MEERLTSLLKYLWAALSGLVLGLCAVLLHNTLVPVGLVLTFFSEAIGIWYLGRVFGAKRFKLIGAIAWFGIVLRAGTPGAGNEILVMGDSLGTIFLLGSRAIAVITVMKRI